MGKRVDRYCSGQADEGRESQTPLILPGPTAERRLTANFISRLCHTRKVSPARGALCALGPPPRFRSSLRKLLHQGTGAHDTGRRLGSTE